MATQAESREPRAASRRYSLLAEGLIGSPILKIATEVRALVAQGAKVCNLTVGDFAPSEFPVPELLTREIVAAVQRGETNYPPSNGMPQLRKAVADFSNRRLGLKIDPENVVITGGARPVLYGAYRILVDAGERVVFPVPSWNNEYYCQIVGAQAVTLAPDTRTDFLPTAAMLRPKLKDARMVVVNSPSNPTGTLFSAEQLGEICDAILEENQRRAGHDRPLYLVYDQMYWMLTFGSEHVHPVGLRPAMADYTVYVDGISKSFASTGLRVGWGIGPKPIVSRLADLLTHVGAWAPRPEQVATAALLNDDTAMDTYHASMRREVLARLKALQEGIATLKAQGFPVDATTPAGAIYLSAKFALAGKKTPDGVTLRSDEDVRSYLLKAAGLAVVPFGAFGADEGSGWVRLSVGAVSMQDIAELMPRVRTALEQLT